MVQSDTHSLKLQRFERAAFETLPRAGVRHAPLGGPPTPTLAALELAVMVLVTVLAMVTIIVSAT